LASSLALSLVLVDAATAATLASAARNGDLGEVRELLAAGSAVNEAEPDGSTAVLWAAYQSDTEMLAALVDAGADVNAANSMGVSPLLQAARTGDTNVIRVLLEAGADPELAVRDGETPLMAAARTGTVSAVSLLLEHGSDPNAAESYQGQTALMWAASEGHTDVVKVLLEAGADPDATAHVSDLSQRSMRTDFPTGGFTAAMWAAREGYADVLKTLADAGADLNLVNGDGASAMSIAIVNDRFDLAASMLGMGAAPDVSALYHAVLMRDATTDWLAKDGTRWRADYDNELTALDLIGVLLEAGGDPNEFFEAQYHSTSMCCDTKERGTPFYRAAVAADVAALELLIEHGADVEWTPEPQAEGDGPNGGPPGMGARAPRSPLAAAMNGGKGVGMAGGPGDIREGEDPPFREQANRDPADAMAVLLAAGADPNRATGNESTLLHDAARARMIDVIDVLAEHGAVLDALNGDGLSALDIAEGRRAEGSEDSGGPSGPPGLPGQEPDDRPSMEQVAARLRELMQSAGVPIVEHGVVPEAEEDEEAGA
jgi:ankyrin repeat protein